MLNNSSTRETCRSGWESRQAYACWYRTFRRRTVTGTRRYTASISGTTVTYRCRALTWPMQTRISPSREVPESSKGHTVRWSFNSLFSPSSSTTPSTWKASRNCQRISLDHRCPRPPPWRPIPPLRPVSPMPLFLISPTEPSYYKIVSHVYLSINNVIFLFFFFLFFVRECAINYYYYFTLS